MANTEDRDEHLARQGVNFLPWIGKKYERGFGNRRLLILGESHYDKWEDKTHVLGKEFTRTCIGEVIDRKSGSPFWKNIEQALLNEARSDGWCRSGGMPLWEKVAFYNFVQEAVRGGPRDRPQWSLFQKSHAPFRAVLEQLRPDRVIVCGKGLWENMEEITDDNDYLHDDVQAYRLRDGTKVWCLATVHPCSGRYSWKLVHRLVTEFLNQPENVARLLIGRFKISETDQAKGWNTEVSDI